MIRPVLLEIKQDEGHGVLAHADDLLVRGVRHDRRRRRLDRRLLAPPGGKFVEDDIQRLPDFLQPTLDIVQFLLRLLQEGRAGGQLIGCERQFLRSVGRHHKANTLYPASNLLEPLALGLG